METIQTSGNHAIDIAWLKLLPKTNPLPPVVPIPTPHGDLAFGWRTPWHQAAPSTLGGLHSVPLAPATSGGQFKQQIRRITSTGGSHPPPSPITAPVAVPCAPPSRFLWHRLPCHGARPLPHRRGSRGARASGCCGFEQREGDPIGDGGSNAVT